MFQRRRDRERVVQRLDEVEKRLKVLECPHDCWVIKERADMWFGELWGTTPVGNRLCTRCGKSLEEYPDREAYLAAIMAEESAKCAKAEKELKKLRHKKCDD